MPPRSRLERVDAVTGRRTTADVIAAEWSSGNAWRDVQLQRRSVRPGELPEGSFLRHNIVVPLTPLQAWEVCWPGRGWKKEFLSPFTIVLVPAGMPYAARFGSSAVGLALEIAPELLAAIQGARGNGIELHPWIGHDPFITQALLTLDSDLRAGSPAGVLYGESLATTLAAYLLQKHTVVGRDFYERTALSREALSRVLQYIGDNLDMNLSVNDLAQVAQMNVYKFLRSFKQSMSLPPHQYILRERIEKAKALLKKPGLPIAEVALRCGFASQSHFTTTFHRMTTVPPRSYRKAVS